MKAEPLALWQFWQWQTRILDESPVTSYLTFPQRQEPLLLISAFGFRGCEEIDAMSDAFFCRAIFTCYLNARGEEGEVSLQGYHWASGP